MSFPGFVIVSLVSMFFIPVPAGIGYKQDDNVLSYFFEFTTKYLSSRLYEKIKMSLPNKLCILNHVISLVEKRLSNLFSRIGRYYAWLYRNFYIGRWILTPILSDFVNTSPKIDKIHYIVCQSVVKSMFLGMRSQEKHAAFSKNRCGIKRKRLIII